MAETVEIIINVDNKQGNQALGTFTQNLNQTKAAITEVNTQGTKINQSVVPAVGALAKQSGAARSTMIGLNYTLRDSPYLFANLNMGIMAISNNIGPMVDGLIAMRNEAGSMRGFIRSLGQSLIGPAGLSLALSGVVALVQVFSFVSAKAKRDATDLGKSAKDAGEEFDIFATSIDDYNEAAKKVSTSKLQEELKKVEERLKTVNDRQRELNEESLKYVGLPYQTALSKIGAELANLTKEETELQKKQQETNDIIEQRGIIEETNISIAEKRAAMEKSRDENEIKALAAEIAGLEAERDRLIKVADPAKQTAELDKQRKAERDFYAEKEDLALRLGLIQGNISEEQLLAEQEKRLNARLAVADLEERREIELDLARIEIDKAELAKKTEAQKLKDGQATADFNAKVAEQEREMALKNAELSAIQGAGEGPLKAQYQAQIDLLNLRKASMNEELQLLQQDLETRSDLSEQEKQDRILKANELKISLIDIEKQIAAARMSESDKAAAKEEQNAERRKQAISQSYEFVTGTFGAMLNLQTQAEQQAAQQSLNISLRRIENQRREALAFATSAAQKNRIEEQFNRQREAAERRAERQMAEAASKDFGFKKVVAVAEGVMNTYNAATKALTAGPILGPILAGLIVSVGLAYVAKISAQKAPALAEGGLVPANVSNGEFLMTPDKLRGNQQVIQIINQSGKIKGPGGPKSDSIRAMIPAGSFVVNAAATNMYEDLLRSISAKNYAEGGPVNMSLAPNVEQLIQGPQTSFDSLVQEFRFLRQEFEGMRLASVRAMNNPPRVNARIEKYETAAIVRTGENEISRSYL